jgi:hypothetical protein
MIRLARTFIREFAGTNAQQREFENRQLSVADTDDELTHLAACLRLSVTVPSPSIKPAR